MNSRTRLAQPRLGLLRSASYWPGVAALAQFFRVSRLAKLAYWRLVAPPDGVYRARAAEIDANFSARTAGEWRKLEGTYGRGAEEAFLPALLSSLRPGDVFYDVGSNIGEYAVFAAKSVGEHGLVVAFEPVKASHERITENLQLNALTNVRPYNLALSDRPGRMTLQVGGFLSRQSKLTGPGSAPSDAQVADVDTGDAVRARDCLPVPNAVKIDVEGWEYQVLSGMREALEDSSCTLLCCEVHPDSLPPPIRPEDVEMLIRDLGFRDIQSVVRGSELHLICRKEPSGLATV